MGLSTLKGNSGFMGIDKRNSVTGNTIGNISRKKYFLERLGGDLAPIVPPPPNPLFEDNFSTGNLNKWNVVNGSEPSKWVVGTSSGTLNSDEDSIIIPSGSTYAAFVSNNPTAITPINSYDAYSDCHIYFDVDIPTNCTSLTLEFDWMCRGERSGSVDYTSYDFGYINFADPATFTPVAGDRYGQGGGVGDDFGRIIETNNPSSTEYDGKFLDDSGGRNPNAADGFVYENITIDNNGTNLSNLWCDNCTRRIVFSWVSDYGIQQNPAWTIANVKLTYNL